jgi:acyl carrier protein
MSDSDARLETARRLLAEAIDIDPAVIPGDVRVGQFERWDSLAHMRLLLALEQRIDRQLDADELAKIESLADVAALLPS